MGRRVPPSLRRDPHMLWYVLGGAAALFACALLIAGGQWYSRQRTRQRADAVASAAASSSVGTAGKADEIKLTVRADARIVDLRAAGAKRVEFDTEKVDRDRGVLTVSPWAGTLPVDVVFEGGATLRLSFDAKGTRDLRAFSAAATVPVSALPTSTGGGGGADKPGKGTGTGTSPGGGRTKQGGADPSGAKRPELQDNPY